MRLYRLEEHLALLGEGGARSLTDVPHSLIDTSLAYARHVWPSLSLKPFGHERAVEAVFETGAGHRLVHVAADDRDTFLIVTWDPHGEISGHLLFDIGAEYRPAVLICPAFEFEGQAERQDLRRLIPALETLSPDENRFAILEVGSGTYMQTCVAEGGGYQLEYQLVSIASHYETPSPVSADAVVSAFESYCFGKYEWLTSQEWVRMDLS